MPSSISIMCPLFRQFLLLFSSCLPAFCPPPQGPGPPTEAMSLSIHAPSIHGDCIPLPFPPITCLLKRVKGPSCQPFIKLGQDGLGTLHDIG